MKSLLCARTLLPIAALVASPVAYAQDEQNMRDREPDAVDVAKTPLTDLNLSRDDIPEVLLTAYSNPYASDGLESCVAIGTEIANLDRVLGDDFDVADDDGGGLSEGRVAQSVVGSFIPFRGIVREVSGAAGDERALEAAVTAGMVRRGFLKGLGQQRGCPYPSRPAPRPASD